MSFFSSLFASKPALFETWTADQVYQAYQQPQPDQVFLDVREPEEWTSGVIPGSTKISLSQLAQQLNQLDKSKRYVLICRSGNRSQMAARVLAEAGFEKLINFQGGMGAWQRMHYPVA